MSPRNEKKVIDKENSHQDIKTKATQRTMTIAERLAFQDLGTNKSAASRSGKNKENATQTLKKIKSPALPKGVINIDTSQDPGLVCEYVQDIYKNLLTLEDKFSIKEGFLVSHKSTPKMRSVLIDWWIQVHSEFKLTLDTLYTVVSIIDRYLQEDKTIGKSNLQLVGVTAMFIASKYEEIHPLSVSTFVDICDNTFTKQEILEMERNILTALDFNLNHPLSLHFLRRYSKVTKLTSYEYNTAKYALELTLVDHKFSHMKPSILAAAAVCLSIGIRKEMADPQQAWSKALTYYSGYEFTDIKVTVVKLACLLGRADTWEYKSVTIKYAAARYNKEGLCHYKYNKLVRKLIAESPLLTKK